MDASSPYMNLTPPTMVTDLVYTLRQKHLIYILELSKI